MITLPRTITPAIFREAARRIAQGENDFACCSLDWTSKDRGIALVDGDSPACIYMTAVLGEGKTSYMGWWGHCYSSEARMGRVFGLLLCAELVQDGFVPEGFSL